MVVHGEMQSDIQRSPVHVRGRLDLMDCKGIGIISRDLCMMCSAYVSSYLAFIMIQRNDF